MKLMSMASIALSMTFMKSSHPIMLMFVILAQTMILCIMIWVITKLSWFSYILFLIFLGGLMVLFIYISSLASNEMFNISIKSTLMSTVLIMVMTIAATLMLNNQLTTQTSLGVSKSFSSVYSSSMILPSAVTMLYLLLTLIVVVKMTSKYEGPMRSLIFTS